MMFWPTTIWHNAACERHKIFGACHTKLDTRLIRFLPEVHPTTIDLFLSAALEHRQAVFRPFAILLQAPFLRSPSRRHVHHARHLSQTHPPDRKSHRAVRRDYLASRTSNLS